MGRPIGSKNKVFIPNTYIVGEEVTALLIKEVQAIFNTKHLDRVKKYKWFYDKRTGYIFCNLYTYEYRRTQYLHKIITEWNDTYVDHIDGNKLNNLDSNLRKCTHQQNMVNRKSKEGKYRGVYTIKNCATFRARIKVNQTTIHLGHFKTQEEAAIAYNQAALKYFGEFARLNIINDDKNTETNLL